MSLVVVTWKNELLSPLPSANGEVLLEVAEVAVAVMFSPTETAEARVVEKIPLPEASVVTVPVPRNTRACTPLTGSFGPLEKKSSEKTVLLEAPVIVPLTSVVPADVLTVVMTGAVEPVFALFRSEMP